MKYKLLILIFVVINTTICICQPVFQKSYKASSSVFYQASRAMPTYDNGAIVAGRWRTNSFTQTYNSFILRTDANGDTLWVREVGYDSPFYLETDLISVIQLQDSSFIATGYFIDNSIYHLLVVKIDQAGNITWSKQYDTPNGNVGTCIRQLNSGDLVIVGSDLGTNTQDIYVLKISVNGTVLWNKSIRNVQPSNPYNFIETSDGGILIGGVVFRQVSFPNINYDGVLIKTDDVGNVQWSKSYSYSDINSIIDLVEIANGSIVLCGAIQNVPTNFQRGFFMLIDDVGQVAWQKVIGYPPSSPWEIPSLSISSVIKLSGNELLLGAFSFQYDYANPTIIKADTSGSIQWIKCDYIEGVDANRFFITSDSSICYFGNYQTHPDSSSVAIVKLNKNGDGCQTYFGTFNQLVMPLAINNEIYTDTTYSNSGISSTLNLYVNYGGSVNTHCITVGMEEQTETEKSFPLIFPNPNYGVFNVHLKSDSPILIRVYDISTRVVIEQAYMGIHPDGYFNVDLNLSPGIYFVKIVTGKSEYIEKIVVQKR